MTFPSSPFPRVGCAVHRGEQEPDPRSGDCGYPTCMYCHPEPRDMECAEHGTRWELGYGHCAWCVNRGIDFPILRSSPLWRQVWLQRRYSPFIYNCKSRDELPLDGGWFPPIVCDRDTPQAWVQYWREDESQWLRRLYTVDNCESCTTALQAVELMVYGIAYELQQWPDAWEHRCFHRCDKYGDYMTACACGRLSVFCDDRWWYEADEMLNVRLGRTRAIYFPPGITATVTSTGESTTVELASGTYEIAFG